MLPLFNALHFVVIYVNDLVGQLKLLNAEANLEAENANYKAEIYRELVSLEQQGMLELDQCFNTLCK